jgi:nucleoside-diphosphate-sugar epimerase
VAPAHPTQRGPGARIVLQHHEWGVRARHKVVNSSRPGGGARRPGQLPLVPLPDRLVLQCVHGDDVGEAYRLAALSDGASGAYNIAAEPVLDPSTLARVLRALRVRGAGRGPCGCWRTPPGARG